MFTPPGKPFRPTGSPLVGNLGFTHKTWLGWKGLPGTNTSVLRTFVNDGRKKWYNIRPMSSVCPWQTFLAYLSKRRSLYFEETPALALFTIIILGRIGLMWTNTSLPVRSVVDEDKWFIRLTTEWRRVTSVPIWRRCCEKPPSTRSTESWTRFVAAKKKMIADLRLPLKLKIFIFNFCTEG